MKQFAEKADIPYRTVQDYVAGKRTPGADHLIRLRDYGIDISWLLTGEVEQWIALEFPAIVTDIGVLAADPDLGLLFFQESINIVDEVHRTIVKKTGEPLHSAGIILSIHSTFQFVSNTIDNNSDSVLRLKREGWSNKEIVDFMIPQMREILISKLKVINPDAETIKDSDCADVGEVSQ